MYKFAARKLLGLLQEKLGRRIHYRNLTDFGDPDNFLDPDLNILDFLEQKVQSPSVRTWIFYVYQRFIVYQMKSANDNREKFLPFVKVNILGLYRTQQIITLSH